MPANALPDGYVLIRRDALHQLRKLAERHGILPELLSLGIEVIPTASIVEAPTPELDEPDA